MGAAKLKGTYEERVAKAKERNANLKWAIENGKDPVLKSALRNVGIRRVVNKLVNASVIKI